MRTAIKKSMSFKLRPQAFSRATGAKSVRIRQAFAFCLLRELDFPLKFLWRDFLAVVMVTDCLVKAFTLAGGSQGNVQCCFALPSSEAELCGLFRTDRLDVTFVIDPRVLPHGYPIERHRCS